MPSKRFSFQGGLYVCTTLPRPWAPGTAIDRVRLYKEKGVLPMKRSTLSLLLSLGLGLLVALGVLLYSDGAPPTAQAQGPQLAGEVAYVALSDSSRLARIDVASKTLLGTINLAPSGCEFPWRLALNPAGTFLYVSCRDSDEVAVINTATNRVRRMVRSGIESKNRAK